MLVMVKENMFANKGMERNILGKIQAERRNNIPS